MHATIAIAAFAALAAAQGVRQDISPGGGPPPGCSSNYDGSFTIAPVNVTSSSKRDLTERQNSPLSIMLQNGILTDSEGRTGYIAANQQFQFDKPPQAGAIYTAGWSVCQNGTLALGTDAVFYRCLSGGFYNLYFESRGGQCIESLLLTRPLNEAGAPGPVSGPAAPSSTPMMASTMSSMPAMSSPMSMSSMMTSSMMSSMPTSYAPPMTGGAMGTTAMSAPSAAAPSSVVPATNGAATMGPELFGLAAGILALAAL